MASTLIPRKPQLIGVLACIYIVMFFSVIYIRGHEWTNVGTPVSLSVHRYNSFGCEAITSMICSRGLSCAVCHSV